jgi:glycosyltransferase involved in cell wall biosynthesis
MAQQFSSSSGRSLAVVVPMYNELAGAERCLRELLATIPRIPMRAALVIVDDGSNDGTGDLLDRLHASDGGFKLVHKPNGGYGSALVAGARAALEDGHDYVLFMDSDLTNPPAHIERFVPAIRDGYDLVKGTRFTDGGDMGTVGWSRWMFSKTASAISRSLFRMGLSDCTNGFRAIRAEMFVRMPLRERGFAVIMEELFWAKRWGATVTSVPTSLSERTADQRATMFSYRPAMLWSYLKYALRASRLLYRPRAPTRRAF